MTFRVCLLVVLAILTTVVVCILVPKVREEDLRSPPDHYLARLVLRRIHEIQGTPQRRYTIGELAPELGPHFRGFERGYHGYKYEMQANPSRGSWCVRANPIMPGPKHPYYYIDDTGILRLEKKHPASAASPIDDGSDP